MHNLDFIDSIHLPPGCNSGIKEVIISIANQYSIKSLVHSECDIPRLSGDKLREIMQQTLKNQGLEYDPKKGLSGSFNFENKLPKNLKKD